MATITIRFEGICCHIKPPVGSPITVERRSIVPDISAHIPTHVRYIEMFTNDVDTAANPAFSFTTPYTRYGTSYQYVPIENEKIELLNITSTTFETRATFGERIPMLSHVEPRFTGVKAALLQPTVAATEQVAYFDITKGILSSGLPEGLRTEFVPTNLWPVKHLGEWAQLDVEVSGSVPMLKVTNLQTGTDRMLVLKDGAGLITIGNQTDLDIVGIPSTSGHFAHFYDLADPRPANPVPLPKHGLGLGAGCSNTQWP